MMQETASDSLDISAVMLKQASQHPWGEDIWSLAGLVPGLSQSELSELEAQGELHIWSDLTLQLYPLHCDSYYHNLISGKPNIYLVCQHDDNNQPQALLITVDYDEAASYMETGELVLNTELPTALCEWLEAYVLTHYQPEKPKKRRRKQWHDEAKK